MKKIDNKHLLVVGKDKIDRHKFVKNILDSSDKQIYKIPPGVKRFEDYIEHVRRTFPFIPENWDEQNPNKWTLNQVWDFHLDWTEKTRNILILIDI